MKNNIAAIPYLAIEYSRFVHTPDEVKYMYKNMDVYERITKINQMIKLSSRYGNDFIEITLDFEDNEDFKGFKGYFNWYGYDVNVKSYTNNEYNLVITWPWFIKTIDIEEDPNEDLEETNN